MAVHDYLDPDVAYLLGALVARGTLINDKGIYRLIVRFPKGHMIAEGVNLRFDTTKEIRLGIEKIRDRISELIAADIKTVDTADSIDLVAVSSRHSVAWRNLSLLLDYKTDFAYFKVPSVLLEGDTPVECKHEFMRGFADVAGNVRLANRDQAGRNRVRLDILNYPTNWDVPVQLCTLLQDHLGIPVPVITWGHPNLGREWREHQLNVYCEDFLKVGFFFDFKQVALESLAEANVRDFPGYETKPCPGRRKKRFTKPHHPLESCSEKLDPRLVGKHFNAYWEICKALGCKREPPPGAQLEIPFEE